MITISGYHIGEMLYESPNSLVYRGRQEKDSRPVILKLLKEAYPSPERIAEFRREFEVTRSLNGLSGSGEALAGVVAAYDLVSDHNRWLIVLEDFGGDSLRRLKLAGKLTLPNFFKLAIAVTDILGQIHGRQIMHKDLNPSNIVLNAETGVVKIIDFGISTVLSREDPTFRNPNVLEGTLAYLSPEQTGRMNRAMDYRTDFYSLGVTFYELLTGQPPFTSSDALELVHCHLAQSPTPPHELQPDLPPLISELILKLMAKNAEDRYQSAYGLQADLETCLQQWQSYGQINPFPLGQHDVSGRFQIAQKLYGRERETDILLAAFERVASPQGSDTAEAQSKVEMLLVAGYAGIGKTALLQEVYKPLTYWRGYFTGGKFDQLQRDIPYTALLQAFRSLLRQLLTESEASLAAWRKELLAALGPNGRVISEVIPEVELIIGPQPAIPELSPTEAQNRFNLVFQNFMGVFTRPEHPLVIFLDDLQWADAASLQLLGRLLTTAEQGYLFLVGAYRDNEVDETHPLKLALKEIEGAGVAVGQILLAPLALPDIIHLIADTLNCDRERATPLAELVQAKTGGNPFFVNQFLHSLYDEKLLTLERMNLPPGAGDEDGKIKEPDSPFRLPPSSFQWRWDLAQIRQRGLTDNVVELLAGKVQQLPDASQQVLKLAACVGNRFDLETVAIIHQKTLAATAADLWAGLVAGLILPLGDAYKLMALEVPGLSEAVTAEYKFAHDRVQQAVYSLIPEAGRQAVHWQVGQLLLQNTPAEEREQKIFDLVGQLNRGRSLIQTQAERDELASLNLLAGQRAKAAVAYQAAFTYLRLGLELLGEDSWQRHYNLSLSLHEEATELAYLVGELEVMSQTAEIVLKQAKTPLDQANVYEVQIQAYIAQGKLQEALATALRALSPLGISFPEQPQQEDVGAAIMAVQSALGERNPADLITLPKMTDLNILTAMRILTATYNAAYASAVMFPLIVCKKVALSLQYGHCAESTIAYNNYGMILTSGLNNINAGYEFGQLAFRLLEELEAKKYASMVRNLNYFFLRHGKEHLKTTLHPLQNAYQIGLESGNTDWAAGGLLSYSVNAYLASEELELLEQNQALYHRAINQAKQLLYLTWFEPFQQAVLNWRGKYTTSPWILVGAAYDETQPLGKENPSACFNRHFNKLILCYGFGEFQQAVEQATLADEFVGIVALGTPLELTYRLYHSLAHLAVFPDATVPEQEELMQKVAANQEKLKLWADHAPMNYLHKFCLVEAERARVLGQGQAARDYYDQAIELAHQHEYLNEEALAYELAARFYLAKGQTRLAGHYLRDAHYAYRRWGALTKVKDLETRYSQFLVQVETRSRSLPVSTTPTTTSSEAASSTLDLTSVLKASQAISGEIVLDRLLEKLMKIVIENAGAQRGYLILEEEGRWVIAAEGSVAELKAEAETKALHALPLEESRMVPMAIINYVARTREHVVLSDAAHEGIFTQDSYITQNGSKSVLGAPLINQGKLDGILYLENNLAAGAFTPDRLEVLNMLSAQAAISIENARLYTRQVALTHAASRFVPYEFLHILNKENIVKVNLGDQMQQDMTILVSDIRSFTTLSEKMTPQENFDFVNVYLGQVSPIIRQHHGFIAKYMGDGLMAVFPGRSEDALDAAVAQMRELARYNLTRQQHGEAPIQVGIGIHAGPVMLGTVGEAERMQLDLLSDAVNVTARLEGLTKLYGIPLVISTAVLQRLTEPDRYQLRFLGKTPLKGRQELLSLFEIFDGDSPEVAALKLQTKTIFEQGLSHYHNRAWAEAQRSFEEVLQHYPDDKAAQFYLEQLAALSEPRLPGDGV